MTISIARPATMPDPSNAVRPPPEESAGLGLPFRIPAPMEAVAELDGTTSQMISLWIDLVRQACPGVAHRAGPIVGGLSVRQLNALDCIPSGGLTMRQLARALRIADSRATALADHLVSVGAVCRERDQQDRRVVRVMATDSGSQLATTYRHNLEASLENLLCQLDPPRLAVVALAMAQLGDRTGADPGAGFSSRDRTEMPVGNGGTQELEQYLS
ncbi:MAG: MarR family winged helix-turn-helix transcriptional regulator [Candidatus Dormibacteria bacterium]